MKASTRQSAEQALAEGMADAVAFGKLFIANPDLPAHSRQARRSIAWDTTTFYSGGAQGYTDYPALATAAIMPVWLTEPTFRTVRFRPGMRGSGSRMNRRLNMKRLAKIAAAAAIALGAGTVSAIGRLQWRCLDGNRAGCRLGRAGGRSGLAQHRSAPRSAAWPAA